MIGALLVGNALARRLVGLKIKEIFLYTKNSVILEVFFSDKRVYAKKLDVPDTHLL